VVHKSRHYVCTSYQGLRWVSRPISMQPILGSKASLSCRNNWLPHLDTEDNDNGPSEVSPQQLQYIGNTILTADAACYISGAPHKHACFGRWVSEHTTQIRKNNEMLTRAKHAPCNTRSPQTAYQRCHSSWTCPLQLIPSPD
jgi:hypothetical protein